MAELSALSQREDTWIPSVCSMCYNGCAIRAHRVDGVMTRIEGNPTAPATQGRLCAKGNAGIMTLYDPYRLKTPLKRTNPRKGLGEDPRWVEISWDEAFQILTEKLVPIREENPNGLCMSAWNYHNCLFSWNFGLGFGSSNTGLLFSGAGGHCGNGSHMVGEMVHQSYIDQPDYEYAKYIIIAGGGIFESWNLAVPSARWVGDGREKRGLKLVVVDPRGTGGAAKADDWLPIRPGTDAALFLAWINVLVNELSIFDAQFLKKSTNAPYLIGQDGHYLRHPETGKPLVWDAVEGCAKAYNDPTIKDFSLTGECLTPAGEGKPAFHLFKEHVKQYTPEWAATITTIPVTTIRRIAREFGEAASIGSTIVIDGKEYPNRPVSVSGYRGLNDHTNALCTCLAQETLCMIVGALRAPGGLMGQDVPCHIVGAELKREFREGRDGMALPAIFAVRSPWPFMFPPERVDLKEFWPVATATDQLAFLGQAHPEKYKLKDTIKALMIICSNPVMNCAEPQKVIEGLLAVPFIADVTIYVDETAELADILLPDCTYLERWCFLNWTVADEGMMVQQPVVKPLYNCRDSMDALLELADRIGFLTGPAGFNFWFNRQLVNCGVRPVLEESKKYTWRGMVERAVETITGQKLEWFIEHGHNLKPLPADKKYLLWGKSRLPLYHEWLMGQGEELRKNMVEARVKEEIGIDPDWLCSEYKPLPTWDYSPIHRDDPEYDLFAISFKTALGRFGTLPATNPWLMEIAERDPYLLRIMINTETAKRKGLKDGDLVWVESKVGRVRGRIRCTELIHHETLGFPVLFGHWMRHPIAQGRGPHFNSLLHLDLEHTGKATASMEGTARVKIYKAK